MVSSRDRALIEARAQGIDVDAGLKRPFRQMLKLDIVGSAFAISVFLIIYYVAVGFFPVFFQTVFGYSQSKANALGNWFWAFDALGLLIIGFLSDLTRVRKPFMLVGAVLAIVFTAIFATRATHPDTSYRTFVVLLICVAVSLGIAYAPWMASFTETVERRNPALTATGLAVWGLVIRIVIAVSVFFVPHVVNTVTTLVDKGATVQEYAAGQNPGLNADENATVKAVAADANDRAQGQAVVDPVRDQLATAAKLKPATAAALAATPNDPATQAEAVSELSGQPVSDVAKVIGLSTQYKDELATAAVLQPATQQALLTAPDRGGASAGRRPDRGRVEVSPAAAARQAASAGQGAAR